MAPVNTHAHEHDGDDGLIHFPPQETLLRIERFWNVPGFVAVHATAPVIPMSGQDASDDRQGVLQENRKADARQNRNGIDPRDPKQNRSMPTAATATARPK